MFSITRASTFWLVLGTIAWIINLGIYIRAVFFLPVTNFSPGVAVFFCLVGTLCLGILVPYIFALVRRLCTGV